MNLPTLEEIQRDGEIAERATEGLWEECGHSITVWDDESLLVEWLPNGIGGECNSRHENDREAIINAMNRLPTYLTATAEMHTRITSLEGMAEEHEAGRARPAHFAGLPEVYQRALDMAAATALRAAVVVLREGAAKP